MNTRRRRPLILPFVGRWARVGFGVLFFTFAFVGVRAQTSDGDDKDIPKDRNSELRTRTWSVYGQGGLSWATDVWFRNVAAKKSYRMSPAVGGGVDYTIRPWVRVGAEYLWSRYRREQRFSELDTKTALAKTYGNYLMNFHNIKLGAGFNFMELWPDRNAQWFNIWAGTGVGYTFAKGNEYSMNISTTKTQNGVTTPFTGNETVNNDGNVTLSGSVRTQNRHEKFNKLYIPLSLHFEADVCRQVTLGLKGETDRMVNRKNIAPKNLFFALATVRYNFVPSRARVQKDYYTDKLSALNDRMEALQREADAEKARADREEAAHRQAEQENAELQRQLEDCEHSKAVAEAPSHYVQFAHNSSLMSREEMDRLRSFARSMKGHRLSLTAEASTPGTKEYNQGISERRLKRVVDFLVKEGFDLNDLKPSIAIGSQNGKPSAEGRRVTIIMEK